MERDDFAALAALHCGEMVRVAAALVGPTDAEDAVQEALTRAWTMQHTLRDRSALRPWLLHITVNICRNLWGGRYGTHRRQRADLDDVHPAMFATIDPGTAAETGALDLRQAIKSLETESRMIVVLRYYAGLDASEIGAAMHLPPATVRTRLRRALTRLRQELGEQPSLLSGGDYHAG